MIGQKRNDIFINITSTVIFSFSSPKILCISSILIMEENRITHPAHARELDTQKIQFCRNSLIDQLDIFVFSLRHFWPPIRLISDSYFQSSEKYGSFGVRESRARVKLSEHVLRVISSYFFILISRRRLSQISCELSKRFVFVNTAPFRF